MSVRVSVEGCVEGSVKNCSVDGWDKLPLGLKADVVEHLVHQLFQQELLYCKKNLFLDATGVTTVAHCVLASLHWPCTRLEL